MSYESSIIFWTKRNVLYIYSAICVLDNSCPIDGHVIAPQIFAFGDSEKKSSIEYVHISVSGDGGIRTPVQSNPSSFRI